MLDWIGREVSFYDPEDELQARVLKGYVQFVSSPALSDEFLLHVSAGEEMYEVPPESVIEEDFNYGFPQETVQKFYSWITEE